MEERIKLAENIICSIFNIKESELFLKNREYDLVEARRIFYYLVCRIPPVYSMSKIEKMKGQDHSTIVHALKKLSQLISCPNEIELRQKLSKCINIYKIQSDILLNNRDYKYENIIETIHQLILAGKKDDAVLLAKSTFELKN